MELIFTLKRSSVWLNLLCWAQPDARWTKDYLDVQLANFKWGPFFSWFDFRTVNAWTKDAVYSSFEIEHFKSTYWLIYQPTTQKSYNSYNIAKCHSPSLLRCHQFSHTELRKTSFTPSLSSFFLIKSRRFLQAQSTRQPVRGRLPRVR